MTFRNLILLGGIGGLVYAHRKRGGQMTVESFKQTGQELFQTVKSRAMDLRQQAEQRLGEVSGQKNESNISDVGSSFGSGSDVTGYGTSGYGYGGGSTNR